MRMTQSPQTKETAETQRPPRIASLLDHALLQFFEHGHLPPHLAEVSKPFGAQAQLIEKTLPANAERSVAGDLIATLAEQPGKDGRNVAVTALRKRLGFVQGLIQQCNVQLDPPDAAALDPGSGTHPTWSSIELKP
jgi:hypothetical protein